MKTSDWVRENQDVIRHCLQQGMVVRFSGTRDGHGVRKIHIIQTLGIVYTDRTEIVSFKMRRVRRIKRAVRNYNDFKDYEYDETFETTQNNLVKLTHIRVYDSSEWISIQEYIETQLAQWAVEHKQILTYEIGHEGQRKI